MEYDANVFKGMYSNLSQTVHISKKNYFSVDSAFFLSISE